jgi:hypothetical protein
VRAAVSLAACALLSACAAGVNEGGLANYDALKRASADCEAKGGELQLRNEGNAERISDFSCKRK